MIIRMTRMVKMISTPFSESIKQTNMHIQRGCFFGRLILICDCRPPRPATVHVCKQSHTTALISHASKVMLKILQTRLQEYMNREFPNIQAGFRKGRGTRDQIANMGWIIEKAREFQKNIYFCFTDYTKAFDCVDPNNLRKILKEMGIPDYLT